MAAYLYQHFFAKDFQAPTVDLTGKVAIVTGSNAGEWEVPCAERWPQVYTNTMLLSI